MIVRFIQTQSSNIDTRSFLMDNFLIILYKENSLYVLRHSYYRKIMTSPVCSGVVLYTRCLFLPPIEIIEANIDKNYLYYIISKYL